MNEDNKLENSTQATETNKVAVAKKKTPLTIQNLLKSNVIIKSAERTLGSRGQQFITSVLALANSDEKIAECEPYTTYNACLTAATLNLPINKNLGFAHIVPYKNKKKGIMEAQFQMGWKGFVQLAMRSGEFKTIGVREVKEDELVGLDEFTGEPVFKFNISSKAKPIGYMAYFKLINGFEKAFYMSTEELRTHAGKYSQSFKLGYGIWIDNFNAMAEKTVLKLLLSKFAPLSTEMITAIEEDQKVDGEYADNDNHPHFLVEGSAVGESEEDRVKNKEETN